MAGSTITTTAPAPSPRVYRLALAALVLAAAAALIYHASYYAWWCYDDSYISMRYAENLARHGALEYNLGERVEGYSNLLWTLQLAMASRLGLPMLPTARFLGIASLFALFITGLWWLGALGRRMGAGWAARLTGQGLLALSIVCASPLVLHAQSGLETVQYAFLLDLAFLAGVAGAAVNRQMSNVKSQMQDETLDLGPWTFDKSHSLALWLSSAAMSLAILSRPEGFAYYPFYAAALMVQVPFRQWFVFLRRRWAVLALPLAVMAALFAWRLAYYGLPLPLTVMAKRAVSGEFGLRALADVKMFFTYGVQWQIYLIIGPLIAWLLLPRVGAPAAVRRQLIGLIFLVLANLMFVIKVGGDILNTSRFMIPSILPLAALLCAAVTWFAHEKPWDSGRPRAQFAELRRELSLMALAILLLAGAKINWGQSRNLFHGVDFYTRDLCNVGKARFWSLATQFLRDGQLLTGSTWFNGYCGLLIPFIQDRWMPGQSVLIGDIGLAGLLAPDVRIIDSNGLVSAEYAWLHHHGRSPDRLRHEADLLASLDRARPEWVVLVSRTEEPELFPDVPFSRWAGARAYQPLLTFWDWGERANSGWPLRRIEVLHRKDLPIPDPAAIRRNDERLRRLFPNAPEVRDLCASRAANRDLDIPHRFPVLNATEPSRNRVQIKDKALAGVQFLGRFDNRTTDSWTFTGPAMQDQPTSLSGGRWRPIQGFVGNGLIDTCRGWPVNTAPTGEALSPAFTPRPGDALGFLIGGDSRPETGVALEVNGAEVRRWHGASSCLMRFVLADLTPYAGQSARIRVIDRSTGDWGSVQADHFLLFRPE